MCNSCNLNHYSKYSPYIGQNSKFIIVGDTPLKGHLIVKNDSPFWDEMNFYGLKKADFSIIFSINCYLKSNPSEVHRDTCRNKIKEFFHRQPDIKNVIIAGNYALHTLTDRWGIKNFLNVIENRVLFGKTYKTFYFNAISSFSVSDDIKKSIKRLSYV